MRVGESGRARRGQSGGFLPKKWAVTFNFAAKFDCDWQDRRRRVVKAEIRAQLVLHELDESHDKIRTGGWFVEEK